MKKKPIESLPVPLPYDPWKLDHYDPEEVFACLFALALVLSTPIGSEIFGELAKHYEMLELDDRQTLRRYTELCEKRPCWEREQLCIHLAELGALIRCQRRIIRRLALEIVSENVNVHYVLLDRVIENELIEYNRNYEVVSAMHAAA